MRKNNLFMIKDLVYRKYLLFLNILVILLPFCVYETLITETIFNQYYWIWFVFFVAIFIFQKTGLKDYKVIGHIYFIDKSIDIKPYDKNKLPIVVDYSQIELMELVTDGVEGQKNEWVYYVNLQEKTGKGNLNIKLRNGNQYSFKVLRMPRMFYNDDLIKVCEAENVKLKIIP